ncbi:MAG: hypothetical protein Q7S21_03320 [archaeon]|nr:hypothetical protein [archaeon]
MGRTNKGRSMPKPRRLKVAGIWRVQRERKKAKRNIVGEFAASLKLAKATNFTQIHSLVENARKVCEMLKAKKDYKKESKVERVTAKVLANELRLHPERRDKIIPSIISWLEKAATSAEKAGQKEIVIKVRKRINLFRKLLKAK